MTRPNWLRQLCNRFTGKETRRSIRRASRLGLESLEAREVPATISISDSTINEADNLSVFVPGNTAVLTNSADLGFGPDRNGDLVADLYVIGRNSDNVVVYDGQTGGFVEEFLPTGAGLDGAAWLIFGPNGDLFTSTITETGNRDAILRVDRATKVVSTFITNNPTENGGLLAAKGMAFGPGDMFYVADANGDSVLRYDGSSGAFLDVFVSAGSGGLDSPGNVIFGPDRNNDAVGDLYVSSSNTHDVLVYSGADGTPLGAFVTAGNGGLLGPHDMEFGPDGHLYVVSSAVEIDTIYRFNGATGALIDIVVANGLSPATDFITFDGRGDMYIANEGASNVLRYSAGPLVTLSEASAGPVTVDFSTANATATSGADYGAVSGTLTFAPGETSKRILLSASNDGVVESDETFTVDLSNAVGATLTDSQGVVTILDGDMRVNTTTAGVQIMNGETHNVASDGAGNFVVVWFGNGPGDADGGTFFQRYAADGSPLGSETRANVVTNTRQYNPVVGRASSNGQFVIAWNSDPYSVFGRVYNTNGTPATGEITIALGSGGVGNRNFVESIAVDADGDFVVLYRQINKKPFSETHNWEVRRFNAAGQAQGKSIPVASSIPSNGQGRVAVDANGNFVVAWTSAGIRAQRYTNAGKTVGSQILVSATGIEANVGRDADGDFVVTWDDKAQVFNNNGTKRGDVITFSAARGESVAMQANGDFVLSWTQSSPTTSTDVFAQRFDLNGVAKEAAHRVNVATAGNQEHSGVAVANSGNYVAVWSTPVFPAGPDPWTPVESDVWGRFFAATAPLMAAGGPAAVPVADSALTARQASPLLQEALRRWRLAGADTSSLAGVQVKIMDLPDGVLGLASGNTVTLDDNAADWGWFVDRTPRNGSEYRRAGDQGEQGRMDLLSVLTHEIGHLLGHDHADGGVMSESLAPGIRTVAISGINQLWGFLPPIAQGDPITSPTIGRAKVGRFAL